MSLHNTFVPFDKKVEAVKKYLATEMSLRKTAKEFGIPYKSLWWWVKRYREGGIENLKKKRVRWKRLSSPIELKAMFLKEQNPSLTIKNAQQLLKKQEINMSSSGIWRIWKRYGLAKRTTNNQLGSLCDTSPESESAIVQAENCIRKGNLRSAAKIINALPCMPSHPIIKEIPEKFLSARRRLDRLDVEKPVIPVSECLRRARRIGRMLEKEGYIYSSISANFIEAYALGWLERPREKLILLKHLAKKIKRLRKTAIWFEYYFYLASTYCNILRIHEALDTIKKCRSIVHRLPSYYHEPFGDLLTFFGKHKEASFHYKKALVHEKSKEIISRLALKVALIGHGMAGDYEGAKKMIAKTQIVNITGIAVSYYLAKAYIFYGQGNLAEASNFYRESLRQASKEELYNRIYATSTGLASVSMALNKKAEATMYLTKYLSLLKKRGLSREALLVRQAIGSCEPIAEELLYMPPLRLLNLLVLANRTGKTGDYRKAFNFAQRQRLLGIFHRWIVFFPRPILNLLDKGKKTGLPETILKFPIFNQNKLVYHIKFLGDIVIFKDQHYMRTKMSPQEKAFLIHLGLRAGAPGKFILLRDIYQNFWKKSARPSDRLLHLLTRVKKKLRIPGYLLSISSAYGELRLINRGIYITTDYDDFETLTTQAKSLERANEWHFAKRDYLRTFTLIRDVPFKKMYDDWSESMRRVILNKLENEAINFCAGMYWL